MSVILPGHFALACTLSLECYRRAHPGVSLSEVTGQQLIEWIDESAGSLDSGMFFAASTDLLDRARRPYVIFMIDTPALVEGDTMEEGVRGTFWRATMTREGAVDGLRALATFLEENPEQLEGITDEKAVPS